MENFTCKNGKFSDKKFFIFFFFFFFFFFFSYFCSKDRLWVLVRTAAKSEKNNVYPCKPEFYYIKVGFKGFILYRHVFVMDSNEDAQHTIIV